MTSTDNSNGYECLTDTQLISMVQLGKDKAITTLIGRYRTFVQSLATRYFSYSLEPEDIVQEGMLALLLAAYSYSPTKKTAFRTYCAVCVNNRMRSVVKQQTNSRNIPLNQYISIDDIDLVSNDDPADLYVADEYFQQLYDTVNQELSLLEKNVLNEILNGYTYREVGLRLGISEKSVNNALQRLRNKLKTAMSNT